MAIGPKARNPRTSYMVYGFSVNGKIYYVGIGQADSERANDRWKWAENQLERLKREGKLPPGKERGISKGSGVFRWGPTLSATSKSVLHIVAQCGIS